MGRNTNSSKNNQWDVPLGGIVLRNYAFPSLVSLGDGKQFVSNYVGYSVVLSRSAGYGKFIDAYSSGVNYPQGGINAQYGYQYASFGCGTVVPTYPLNTSVISTTGYSYTGGTVSGYIGYGPDVFVNTPSSTIGNLVVVQSKYSLNTSSYNQQPVCVVYNTSTKTWVENVLSQSHHVWYDSSTSTTRILGGNNSTSSFVLATSTDNATFTTQTVSGFVALSSFNSTSGSSPSIIASNQFVGAVCYNGTTGYSVYVSTDGGLNFTDVTANLPGAPSTITWNAGTNGSFQSYNPATSTWVIWPTAGTIAYSTNNGTTWTTATGVGGTATPANRLCTVYGASPAQIMAVANAGGGRTVSYTSNSGATWTNTTWAQPSTISAPNLNPLNVVYMGGNWYILLSTGNSQGGGIWVAKSTNNGSTWSYTQVETGVTNTGSLLFAFDSVLYLASIGSNTIYRSTDGVTWTTIYQGFISVPGGYCYGYNLTNYVNICDIVINKSTGAALPVSSRPTYFYDTIGVTPIKYRLTADMVCVAGANIGTGPAAVILHESATSTQYTYATVNSDFWSNNLGNGSNFNYAQTYEFMRVR